MKKKKLIILIICSVIMLAGIVGATYAWLTDEKNGTSTFTIGDITYAINTPSNGTNVVPGQNLLGSTAVSIKNKSNVKSNVRLQINATASNGTDTETWKIAQSTLNNGKVVLGSITDKLIMVPTAGWTYEDPTNNSIDDGYWYLGSSTTPTEIAVSTDLTNGIEIASISYVTLNGNVVGNNYSNWTITFQIVLQAKQSEYVDWVSLGSINWTNGI